MWFFTFVVAALILPLQGLANPEHRLSKQLAWTAAHLDNPTVVREFIALSRANNNDPEIKKYFSTSSGIKLKAQQDRLLKVIEVKRKLDECLLEHQASQSIREAIHLALNATSTQQSIDPCPSLTQQAPKVLRLGGDLKQHYQTQAQEIILRKAQTQLEKTKKYWQSVEGQVSAEMAIDLTEQIQAQSLPSSGPSLLLYTKALEKRAQPSFVTIQDIKAGLSEVKSELVANQKYLNSTQQQSPENALPQLIATNPLATAEYLVDHPEGTQIICEHLVTIEKKAKNDELIDSAFLWGGLIVGGVLVASGVGALAGASILTSVAAGAALTGTALAAGETLYASNKAHSSYILAQEIKSSGYAEGFSASTAQRVQQAQSIAQDDALNAGLAVASIIPFGAGYKVMRGVALAGQKSSKALNQTLRSIASDPQALKNIERSAAEVSEEEMGLFLGNLSRMSATQKSEVLRLAKANPDKLSQAIRKSAKEGDCR